MKALSKMIGLALLATGMATTAHAARNLEVLVRDERGEALAGAAVCLGYRSGESGPSAAGSARTDAMGVAEFENVPVNGAWLKVNVTSAGYRGGGATRTFQMTNNVSGMLEPPQMQTVDLPGDGAECDLGGGPDPEPSPEPDPQPPPGPGHPNETTQPTPIRTFHVRTVDYDGRPVGGVTVCAGDGPGEGGSLFGRTTTDASGVGSIAGVPSGGDGYRRVTLTAVKACGEGGPRAVIDGTPVYACGVGAEYAQPDHANPGTPFTIVIGAVDEESAAGAGPAASRLCPSPGGDANPTAWRLVADEEVEEGASISVRASLLRGSRSWLMGWLFDFEWEVSDPSVLEIVGSARAGDRIVVRGKRPGTATVTARLARTDGALVASPGGSETIDVVFAGGIDPERSVAAFASVQGVFHHPRCANCHVAGRSPKQGDDRGAHEADGRNVRPSRGDDCTRCHSAQPASPGYQAPHVPGITWRMPPEAHAARMSFEDPETIGQLKLPGTICADIKETFRERGACATDQECALAVADHIDHDGLVIWAFQPGGSRSPATMQGHGDFAAKIREWAELGGFCPE